MEHIGYYYTFKSASSVRITILASGFHKTFEPHARKREKKKEAVRITRYSKLIIFHLR